MWDRAQLGSERLEKEKREEEKEKKGTVTEAQRLTGARGGVSLRDVVEGESPRSVARVARTRRGASTVGRACHGWW